MNTDDKKAGNVVEKLIETCKNGEEGYKDAAAHVKRPDLQTYFQQQSAERARFVHELQTELGNLGKAGKKDSGSVAGALHRAWIDTKASLGGGDKTILESVEQGEDNAKANYQEALAGSLPSNVAEIVGRQAASVQRAHDKVKSLRESIAA
jgi:uncharacterized protein (TIGR02284 family)